MIHYHGTPLTPESAAASVFAGRHAMVSLLANRIEAYQSAAVWTPHMIQEGLPL